MFVRMEKPNMARASASLVNTFAYDVFIRLFSCVNKLIHLIRMSECAALPLRMPLK